jgi:hypothetical protein
MCFSATASFTVSGILASVGAVAIAQRPPKAVRMVAVLPLLLAAQQASEGIVWLTMGEQPRTLLHSLSVVVFLGFALAVWPTWLPLSLFMAERDEGRRRTLKKLALLGAGVSAYSLSVLASARPIAEIAAHSIRYEYGISRRPLVQVAYLLLYIVPTVGPFFVSTVQLSKATGSVLLLALVTTLTIKEGALASVWCFFAATLSVLIVIGLAREERLGRLTPALAKLPLPEAR